MKKELSINLPPLKELRSVVYTYADGSQYEMLDVQNYIENLEVS